MKISLKIKTRDKKKFTKNFMGTIFWGAVSLGGNFPGGSNFSRANFLRGNFLGVFFIELLYAVSGHYYMNKISFCLSFEN